jgi:hypothetical protein
MEVGKLPNNGGTLDHAVRDGRASMRTNTTGIRGFWAAYLAVYAAMFVLGVYPYFTKSGPPYPFQLIQTAVDLAVMYGLFGFVVRSQSDKSPFACCSSSWLRSCVCELSRFYILSALSSCLGAAMANHLSL